MKLKTITVFLISLFLYLLVAGLFFVAGEMALKTIIVSIIGTFIIGGVVSSGLFILQQFKKKDVANHLFMAFMTMGFIFLLLLVSGEYLFRFMYKDVTTTVDNFSYFSNKWQKDLQNNCYGFRERDYSLEKPENTYRVAVVGDSLTYGQGIVADDRYSNLLENRLNVNKPNLRYEFINFGKAGAEMVDYISILKLFVLPANPDFILLQWYINDVNDPNFYTINNPAVISKKVQAKKGIISIPPILRKNSALFYLLHRTIEQFRSGSQNSYDDMMLERFGDPDSESTKEAMSNIKTFYQISKSHNIPMGMILFSDSYFRLSSKMDFLLNHVCSVCKAEGIEFVDMRKPFEPFKGDTRLWASRLDPHPSAYANKIVADQLYSAFSPTWLDEHNQK